MKTVAVITPIYADDQRLWYFHQTRQTLQRLATSPEFNFVHLIVDDGSPVDIQSYLKDYPDSRSRYVLRKRMDTDLNTASNAINEGIELCIRKDSSIFMNNENVYAVCYLHSDDLFTKNSLESRLKPLDKGGFVNTKMAYFDENGSIIEVRTGTQTNALKLFDYDGAGSHHKYFNHHTTMWHIDFLKYVLSFVRDRYGQSEIFDKQLSFGEDRDVTLSTIAAAMAGGYPGVYVPEVTVLKRQHPDSITGEQGTREYIASQDILIQLKHFGRNDAAIEMANYLRSMARDLPWSLLTRLPEGTKEKLKPARNFVKRIYCGYKHPALQNQLSAALPARGIRSYAIPLPAEVRLSSLQFPY